MTLESFRPRRAAWGHENTPHTHTHAGFTRLENMHNENPDCMFFNLRRIIVHPHGFTGAAGYVRETRASRCGVLSNSLRQLPDDRGSLSPGIDLSLVGQANRNVREDKEVKTTRQRPAERGRDEPRISAPQCDCGPNGPA